ncbi:MAG: hypothetical protein QXX94_08040 [Candidatus Bathyarchaeia archaeon]
MRQKLIEQGVPLDREPSLLWGPSAYAKGAYIVGTGDWIWILTPEGPIVAFL